ncbi:hypothetical protein P4E94_11750 [Pontiellaceae bacterium B12219]|nr:hypothetical protein [Pontiellaceae bacterium B12219]
MKAKRCGSLTVLWLVLAGSAYSASYTRESGDASWSNLGQWNYYNGTNYVNAISFPSSSDLILLNGGKVLSVDTNAYADWIKLPNASSDATLELNLPGQTLTVGRLHVANNTQAGNGTVNQASGSVIADTLSLRPSGIKSGVYNLSGGLVSATGLEIGNSAAGATGTAAFVQSGGIVTSPDITIGGTGQSTYSISGGTLDVSGALDVVTNGRLNIVGSAPVISVDSMNIQSGSALIFNLDESGITTMQIDGNLDLAHASVLVNGSSYWGPAADFILMEAGMLTGAPDFGKISISGLVNASVLQVDNRVVLHVEESKSTTVFENTTGDGLWGTPGNWSSNMVPSGAILAEVGNGDVVTVAANPPPVDGVVVGGNATLVVRAAFSAAELHIESQGILELELGMLGMLPVSLTASANFDPASQLIIDGSEYEGLDGYLPLIQTDAFVGDLSWTNRIAFVGMEEREPAAVLQADGLWLRLIAPPALSDRLCSLVPASTVEGDYSNTTFFASRALEPTGSAWGTTIEEAHVMDTRLSQVATSNQSWDIRIGRGGQIASFRTPALGETVPPSHSSPPNKSPWMDEVWQGVAIDTSLNGTVDDSPYFIHQAGVYPYKDPTLEKPFYSPMVAASINQQERSFTTINWGQHAHLQVFTNAATADDWHSDLLYFTRFRDLGQGVIEVSLGFYNYGTDMPNYFNMPWGGVRRTSMEYAFFSEPGGIGWTASLTNKFGEGVSKKYYQTGGSMAFCGTSNGTTPALGLVFGQDPDPLMTNQTADSLMRYGYAGGNPTGNEDDWRNYYVISAIRKYNLSQGRGVWARYYYVLGDDLADPEARIAARNLTEEPSLTEFDYSEATTPLIGYRYTGSGATFRILEDGRSPGFFLYAFPISGSFPVYEIIEDDETRHLTWNPYATGVVKTYDGTIGSIRLLGFARRSADTDGSSYSYESMESAMSGAPENYLPSGESLSVRTATPIETWRVRHFGFSDNAGDGANNANPDNDSAQNLYEYALGGNPTNSADIGYLPTSGILAEEGTNFFEYAYARRIGSAGELAYTVESAFNLVSNDWNAAEYIELPMTGNLDADFEAVTNRIGTTGKTNEFIRLKVELE